jgi:SdrD B-like domain
LGGANKTVNFKGSDIIGFVPISISGYKWNDTDGDKTWDAGEQGIENWTIALDSNNDGTADQTTTTDNTGKYTFSNLAAGSYAISEQNQLDWTNTYNGATTIVAASGINQAGNSGFTEALNFGNFKNISISGYKWDDTDGDKIWDAGEQGIKDWKIALDSNNDGTADQIATTDDTGKYTFSNLAAGSYAISEQNQLDWTNTYNGATTIVAASGINQAGNSGFTEALNFGNFKNFSISGQKFQDLKGKGNSTDFIAWNKGEVKIYVERDGLDGLTSGDLSTTTGALGTDGKWSIAGLTLADVGKNIYEVVPDSSVQTGVLFQTVENPGSGGIDTGNNFSNFKPQGPGVGTIGFWKQWTAVWDGNTSNDSTFNTKANFAKADILYQVTDPVSGTQTAANSPTASTNRGLLIGDFNKNGITDASESTIFYSVDEAKAILNSSASTEGQDARYILGKQLVGAWLNVLAGNSYDIVVGTVKPDINNGVKWLQKYTPNEGGLSDSKGDGNLTLNASTYKVSSGSDAWNLSSNLGSGNAIKNVLDAWNNTGLGISLSRDTNTIGSLDQLNTLHSAYPYQTFV